MRNSVDRNFNLLLAEGDAAKADGVAHALSNHGHNITFAADGEAAWHLVNQGDFDLAIIDLDLPGIDGLELLSRMHRADLGIPTIAIGSGSDGDACDRAFGMGASLYVPKPVLMPLLTHSVWCILSNRARDREMRWLKNRLGIESNRTLELAY